MRKITVTICAALGIAAVLAGLTITLAGNQAAQRSEAIGLPSDAEIRKILAERVGDQENSVLILMAGA